MRGIFFIIVLGVAGFMAYYLWFMKAESAAGPDSVPPGQTEPASTGFGTPTTAEPLASELKTTYDQAEALWNEQSNGGGNPAASSKAPLMNKLYSTVLKGIYNKDSHKGLEIKLINDRLTPLGNELFFSKTRFVDDETGVMALHDVQAGQNPDGIAKMYGMPHELINRLRGRDASDSRLNLGDRLKVVNVREKGGNFLHVDKSDFYLDLYIAGLFARRYVISHGAVETPTPIGNSRITDRVINPTWTDPKTHEVYQPEDPRNILGKVWLKFSPDGLGQDGLGIHGYTGPNPQMQARVSNGCVRLDTPQAQELYQLLAHPDRCPTSLEITD
jgi:lipoprotein-anchoring transpeptidase ErfK/SrfK